MSNLFVIINYAVRLLIVLIGVYFLVATEYIATNDKTLLRTAGAVFTLFGIYRVATFYSHHRSLRNRSSENSER